MVISVSNTLTVDNPTKELLTWCKRHLVLANPEYAAKARMGFWLGKTPKKIALYEQRGNQLILPFGTLRSIPKEIADSAIFVSEFTSPMSVEYNAEVPLYDYQKTAVQAMMNAKYGILQSLAGSGKTQMGIALAARLGRRTLWLCHTLDLIKQSRERAELYIDKSLLGTISEGEVNLGIGITFATVQTMSRLDLAQYKNYWDVIITDEVHRVSGSPATVTQYQKVLNSLSARHKYGLSATVHRSDGMIEATFALVGEVVYKVPDEAIGDKVMKVGICPIGTGVHITREVLNTDGTLNYAKYIAYLAQHTARNALIAGIVATENKPSLVLSDRINHLKAMMNLLPAELRKDAVMINGGMVSKAEKVKREQAIEDMRKGSKKFLFATYALAKEGLDIPRLERLYLALPKKDYAVITQSIGRIARTLDGKAEPVVYDFVDDIPHSAKAYKQRCSIYRKNGCYFVGGEK